MISSFDRLIVDSGVLGRSWYRVNWPTTCLPGAAHCLFNIISLFSKIPEKILVLDSPTSWRSSIKKDYIPFLYSSCANTPSRYDSLVSAINLFKDCGFSLVSKEGLERFDLAWILSQDPSVKTIIYTKESRMRPIISPSCSLYSPTTPNNFSHHKILGIEWVASNFGVRPDLLSDIWTLIDKDRVLNEKRIALSFMSSIMLVRALGPIENWDFSTPVIELKKLTKIGERKCCMVLDWVAANLEKLLDLKSYYSPAFSGYNADELPLIPEGDRRESLYIVGCKYKMNRLLRSSEVREFVNAKQ